MKKQNQTSTLKRVIDPWLIASNFNTFTLVFGAAFLILNSKFPIFENIAKSNWIVGLIMATALFIFSVCSNYDEYTQSICPKFCKIWMIALYPFLFLGLIMSLVYINFVMPSASNAVFNWLFGISLAVTICIEAYLDNKYEDFDEIELGRSYYNA